MALFDVKKKMKDLSKVAQDTAKKAKEVDYKKIADDMAKQTVDAMNKTVDTVKSIDVKETVKTSGQIVSGMAKTIRTTKPQDIADGLGEMVEKSSKALNKFAKNSIQTNKDVKKALNEVEESNVDVSLVEALETMYLLILLDNKYTDEEKKQFEEILNESGVDEDIKNFILNDGDAIVKLAKEEDYEETIRENVIEILRRDNSAEQTINKKLFIWDLLVLAKSDKEYSQEEQKFIRSVIRILGVDKSVLSEMEAAYDAMTALEGVKTEDEKYLKEVEKRKNTIQQSIFQLIEDKEV